MARVYRAVQVMRERVVAIKVLRNRLKSDFDLRNRLRYEADILRYLQHANATRTVAPRIEYANTYCDDWRAPCYLVMEMIDGRKLLDHAKRASLDALQRLRLFIRLSKGVGELHSHGLIHCDLKPANILVDVAGQVRILDFGIACVLNPALRSTVIQDRPNRFIGTFQYASPEQVVGTRDELTYASDVYSLGLILYELMAGRPPCERRDKAEFDERRTKAICLKGAALDGGHSCYRQHLSEIIERALQRDPTCRFRNASELSERVARLCLYMQDDSPQGPIKKASRWLRTFVGRSRGQPVIGSHG